MNIDIQIETWPLLKTFRISRGARDTARVLQVKINCKGLTGRGECVPQQHYGESLESVEQQIRGIENRLHDELTPEDLQPLLPAGAARNAVDCALWDLFAKKNNKRVWELLNITLVPCYSAYTLSIDTPENMAREAKAEITRPLLKLKLDAQDIIDRVQAVRDANPTTRLIVDANEAWTAELLVDALPQSKKITG